MERMKEGPTVARKGRKAGWMEDRGGMTFPARRNSRCLRFLVSALSLLQYEVGRVPVLAIIAIRNPACPALWSYWYWYWYWYRGGGVM
jgi:hypothetical protein